MAEAEPRLQTESRAFSWKSGESWARLARELGDTRCTRKAVRQALERGFPGGLLVYHAGRPVEVESYYREGLRVCDPDWLDEEARSIFLGGSFPELTVQLVAGAISEVSKNGDDAGKLFVCIDDRGIVPDAGHYLIYGSERLLAIAAQLGNNGSRYTEALKRRGIPTILAIALPWSRLRRHDWKYLLAEIIEQGKSVFRDREPPEIDFTITLSGPIPSSLILGHEHPHAIPDIHDGGRVYMFRPDLG